MTTGGGRAVRRSRRSRSRGRDERRPLLSRRARGAAGRVAERAVLPFPSHQVDPYRGLAPHFRVDLRARACAACRRARRRARRRRVGAGAAAAAAGAGVDSRDVVRSAAGRRDRSAWRWPRSWSTVATNGRIPSTNTASSRSAAGILDVYPAGERHRSASSSSATRWSRSAASTRARSVRSKRSISSRSFRCASPRGRGATAPTRGRIAGVAGRSSTTSAPRGRCASSSPSPGCARADREVDAQHGGVVRAAASDKTPRERRTAVAAGAAAGLAGRRADSLAPAQTLEELADRRSDDTGQTVHMPVAARAGVPRPHRRLDRGACKQARERGDTMLFVASTHGRAERTVELLHDYELRALLAATSDERVEGAVLVAEGLLSRGFRLPDAGAADLRRDRHLRGRTPADDERAASDRSRRRFCRICAT